ncbi:hypothetical protein BIZ37_27610 [Photobacterium sp. BZF1]|uniref:hypothetical protein n=1 Tax=Photobacterium sp. BZF1 TaxID=1904457 RepID=UPI0016539800|nr:hypothetical protein [Photobacterium sp. BZF1]MBC7006329.1 hypothetical protein [Photobacterium sp. BZF1]
MNKLLIATSLLASTSVNAATDHWKTTSRGTGFIEAEGNSIAVYLLPSKTGDSLNLILSASGVEECTEATKSKNIGIWSVNGKDVFFTEKCAGPGVIAFYPKSVKGLQYLGKEFITKNMVVITDNGGTSVSYSTKGFTAIFNKMAGAL